MNEGKGWIAVVYYLHLWYEKQDGRGDLENINVSQRKKKWSFTIFQEKTLLQLAISCICCFDFFF